MNVLGEWLVTLAIIGLVFGGLFEAQAYGCETRWEGRETKYKLFAGCLVKTKSGEWISERNLREFE